MREEFWSEEGWQEEVWQEDEGCPYGFEFCEDPHTRDLNLCTTECRLYLNSVAKETEKQK